MPPHGIAYKKRVYSPNRVPYPLKRVDWDPDGERNPQTRGASKYERISWDEALDIVAAEIRRIIAEYGPEGVFLQAEGHGETKVVHAAHGCSIHLMRLLGGYTQQIRNPDSWEGWFHRFIRNPKIEFVLVQHPWMENDSLFADIILPSNTSFETSDIGADHWPVQYNCVYLEEQAIAPRGESMSDYEIVAAIPERLGLRDEYTQGKSVEEWIRTGFDGSGIEEAGLCSWEQIQEKKYYVVPTDPDWEQIPHGMIEFYEDPEQYPMSTPSGMLEFHSQRLAEAFANDAERPPAPHWVESSEFHDERISSRRAEKYPLLVVSNHPRWRVHAQLDDVNWFHEIGTCKVRGADGYLYELMWMHPRDAAARGIVHGDVVACHNERGRVLFGAHVTERIMLGVISAEHGARYGPLVPGEFDRGGAINTICPHGTTSKNCAGMVTSGFLAEVEKADWTRCGARTRRRSRARITRRPARCSSECWRTRRSGRPARRRLPPTPTVNRCRPPRTGASADVHDHWRLAPRGIGACGAARHSVSDRRDAAAGRPMRAQPRGRASAQAARPFGA